MAVPVEELKRIACDTIDKHTTDLQLLSKDIFDHPELAFNEHRAHKTLLEFFGSKGLSVEGHFVLDTGFRSLYNHQDAGPNIAVLCEYDALPEIGHACGHNLIAEVGAATSLGIKAALDAAKSAGSPLGKLTIYGTPAEEGGGGKIDFLNNDAFKGVTAAMMAHPWPYEIPGPLGYTNARVTVTYRGKAAHAAGFPWEGVNALDAAVQAYQAVSCMRQQMKPSCRIHGIISNGGTKPNIIPEEASLEYVMRAVNNKDVKDLVTRATSCFEAAAAATGCQVEYKWGERDYQNVVTVPSYVAALWKNQEHLGVVAAPDSIQRLPQASSDMGNVSQVVPSIHPLFYIGSEAGAHTRAFAHAAGSADAQPYALRQAKALAMTAIDLYSDPGLVTSVQNDFRQSLAADGIPIPPLASSP